MKCNGLDSYKQMELDKVFNVVGKSTVSCSKLDSAPHWLINKPILHEIEDAWKTALVEVGERLVSSDANVISSHIIYKIENDEQGLKKLKDRLCSHGNRDREKGPIWSDSSNEQFDTIRLLLSLATHLGFCLGGIDVKALYLQSGPITRDLFVRLPSQHEKRCGKLWKLTKFPYGVSKAGRQWAKAIETWQTNEANIERVHGISQFMFTERKMDRSHFLLGS